MASLGEMLLGLTGQPNARMQAAQALLQAGAPPALAGSTPPAAGTTVPATTAPAGGATAGGGTPPAPPLASAYQSTPDLLGLYSALTSQQNKEDSINRGIDLIAAGFASPSNRSGLVQMAGNTGANNQDPLSLVQAIQTQQTAMQQKSQQLEALPSIAQQYNIPLDTAKELWSTGKLDDFIMQQTKPDRATATLGNGQIGVIDLAKGSEIGAPIGAPKVETGTAKDDATGNTVIFNKADGSTIATVPGGIAPTDAQKDLVVINKQRIANGQQPYTLDQWEQLKTKAGATNVSVNTGSADTALMGDLDKNLVTAGDTADTATQGLDNIQNAWSALNAPGGIIAGSRASVPETEARKLMADVFGYQDDGVTNTEEYLSNVKNAVLANTKKLGSGSGFSDTDRQFLTQMAGADQDMPIQSMKQILRIGELANRNAIISYNKRVAQRLAASAGPDGQPDPKLAAVLQPKPVPELSDNVMNMVDPDDLKAVAQYAQSGKTPPASFVRTYEQGDPSKGIRGYGIGSFQAVLDRVKAEQ